ncbi:hypothetical protein K439DRAFT_1289972, partial [Ramaria rubella]
YPTPAFAFEEITDTQIHRVVCRMSPYKAPGPSGLSNSVLTHCANELTPYLGHLFRATFTLGIFPQDLKTTTTAALRKPNKGAYALAKAWRPIALGETIGKALSGCVAESLSYHAERLQLLPATNFGG